MTLTYAPDVWADGNEPVVGLDAKIQNDTPPDDKSESKSADRVSVTYSGDHESVYGTGDANTVRFVTNGKNMSIYVDGGKTPVKTIRI